MKRIALLSIVCIAAISGATQRSSFLSVSSLTGVTAVGSDPGSAGWLTDWTISLDAGGGTFVYASNTYHITQIFGFWQLDTAHAFTRTGVANGLWAWNSSTADGGNIFGWVNANKAEAINVGGSKTFHYSGGTGDFESLGFHVTTVELFPGTTGNTGHITEDGAPPVPEPATMGLIAAALGVAAHKRRRR